MKQILVFVLGLLLGFLGLETFSASTDSLPRSRMVITTAKPAETNGTITDPETEVIPATDAKPATRSFTAARPASEKPGVFFFTAPTNLYGTPEARAITQRLQAASSREMLRTDAELMAAFRRLARAGLEKDLQTLLYLTRLDPVKFSQVIDIAADQFIEQSLMPPAKGADFTARRQQLSTVNATKLAAVLSPDELETWAGFSRLTANGIFRASIEAFATRGLPQPTRGQLDALTAPRPMGDANGQMYLSRSFNPAAAPESLNPQQRDYLANVARWNRAQLIITNLHATKVRDPEVWEIWPE
jgi:hypothetical protein